MKPLRFAILGAGFWANYQLPAWQQIPGAECVAIYNRTLAKAEKLAERFGVAAVYDDADKLLETEDLDFIDVITNVETHSRFVHLAAKHKTPVICQKPMALTLGEAENMVTACRRARVPFYIHENWRWQTPIRLLKRFLDEGKIGKPFRARMDLISGFPVFKNQPFLRELEQFIITDLGSHILDVARFLFGEAETVYCQTQRVHKNIKGEDVATIMQRTRAGATVLCQMAYAENFLERDRFPETCIFIEGQKGSIELAPDYWIRVTTESGTHAKRYPPARYLWADPAYDVVHASIVPCNANILGALQGGHKAETTADDNLKTVRLVFACYESARSGKEIRPQIKS
ncbi:MAG: Gfo/Idh/MocA family oxidoreductase [Verrucomicrobia subdivision 3 bacterium]|nr:Gfo/Idh/MocA family oxidoreductase [Limisphaerales bacterium]